MLSSVIKLFDRNCFLNRERQKPINGEVTSECLLVVLKSSLLYQITFKSFRFEANPVNDGEPVENNYDLVTEDDEHEQEAKHDYTDGGSHD